MKKIRITWNAPVTLGFSVMCLAVLLLSRLTAGASDRLLFMTYHSSLASPLTWLRFFTHVLGHVSFNHLMGNITYILLLGPMLEEKHGSLRMFEVILITAFVTGIANYILFPASGLCGASGVVFAFILLTSFTGFRDGELPVTVLLVAVIFIGQQITEGLFVRNNISNMAHILGGITGALLGYYMNKKSR